MHYILYLLLLSAAGLWLVPNTSDYFADFDYLEEPNDGRKDFDFLLGKEWKVLNKVRSQRLKGNEQWQEFEATLVDGRKIVGGMGNIDKFSGDRQGRYFVGNSIRIFSPADSIWTIYWVDNLSTKLTYQVKGKFNQGVGTFFGEELYEGKMVKMRFIWNNISNSSARWEQAYWDELRQQWEVNWIMEFSEI